MAGCTQWVTTYGTLALESARGLATNVQNGRVYLGGDWKGQLNLGPGITETSRSDAENGFWVAASSGTGMYQNHATLTGDTSVTQSQTVTAIVNGRGPGGTVDGTVIVGGHFSEMVGYAPRVNKGPPTGGGMGDCFVAKYKEDGKLVWSTEFGSEGEDSLRGLAVDSSGNVLVTGTYKGTLKLNGDVGAPVAGGMYSDVYLAKLNGVGGTKGWLTTCGANNPDGVFGITVDSSDNVTIVGHYQNTLSCTPSQLDPVTSPDVNAFALHLDSNGANGWLKSYGEAGSQYARAVLATEDGLYIAGSFDGTLQLGSNAPYTNMDMTSRDFFVAWLNPASGEPLASLQIRDGDVQEFNADLTLPNYPLHLAGYPGGVALVGSFEGSVTFNTTAPGDVSKADGVDAFVAVFDAGFVPRWHRTFSGDATQRANSAFFDGDALVVAGDFGGETTFDLSTKIAPTGLLEAFLVKLKK